LAAIVTAAERVAALGRGDAGLELVLCAGEETGCEGARRLAD
jgi:acetylornithine deacetylase/succinyl-diaminopimelate desuccinylase-like protein